MGILKTNRIIVIVVFFFSIIYSCKDNKTNQDQTIRFIQSKIKTNLFLIKNPPENKNILKGKVIDFLNENPFSKNENRVIYFYEYTKHDDILGMYNGTSYFIDNLPDPGGFSSEELSNYEKDRIGFFRVSKNNNDSLKVLGEFTFFS